MTSAKTPRATVVVEWEHNGTTGVLVHADRYRHTWILPGGGLEEYKNDKWELPMAAAVRELVEETGLAVKEVKTLFTADGAHRRHHVFLVRTSGSLNKIKDSNEAPAFALCGPDLKPKVFLCDSDYSTDKLRVSSATKEIVTRYYELKASRKRSPATTTPSTTTRVADGDKDEGRAFTLAVGKSTLELTTGDIVTQDVEAVVNAANDQLSNGAGVAGAIFQAAGASELAAACQEYGGCPVGEARITSGFKLQARHIIHAVGPQYREHRQNRADALLASAYRSSLELAREHKLRSIAFPSISTGIYGFPVERAAPIVLETVIAYLRDHQEIEHVRLVLWPDNLAVYQQALQLIVTH